MRQESEPVVICPLFRGVRYKGILKVFMYVYCYYPIRYVTMTDQW